MTCRELTDFILDYLSDELPARLREAFERHLEACPNCRVYLASYELTVHAGKLAFADEGAGERPMPEDLVQAILAARRDVLDG
jgi:anti-sigma factor RsiW